MNEKLKWSLSMLALPALLLLMIIAGQLGYNKSGYISFKGSFFIGEEALFILAVLKIFLSITAIYVIAIIYKRYTNEEFDENYIVSQSKNETHICLDCKEVFIPEGKNICICCGSHAIEPVKGVYSKYPNLNNSKDISTKKEINNILKTKPLSEGEKIFQMFFIAWNILWVSGIIYKVTVDKEFIAIIIFAWPFLVIAYLFPYIIKTIKYK